MNFANVSRLEMLNKSNYDTWKIQMEALLTKNDAWSYVNGNNPKPVLNEQDMNSKKDVEEWIKGDSKAKSEIILSISPSKLKQIKGCITSREVWTKLESVYQSKGPARKATLLKQLTLQRMQEGYDIREHINKFFDVVDKLTEMNVEINPDLLAIMLLYSLPPSFENFRCAIESRDELPTPDVLRIKILEESDARNNSTAQNAMYVNKKSNQWRNKSKVSGNNNKPTDGNATPNEGMKTSDSFRFRCHKCRKIGHKASECYKNKNHGQSSANYSENVNEDICLSSEVCNMGASTRHARWCLDSGATAHLCKDIKNFKDLEEYTNGNLSLANDSSTSIAAKGTVMFTAEVEAPLSVVNIDEIPETEEVVEDDDFTTHTLDRLSSAATCLVAGVEYTHGQQIYRDDPCEFCLCLDGEMFCWWQDCPPTLEGPCRDRLPFSPCANGPRTSASPKVYKVPSTTQKASSSKIANSITTETILTETANPASGTTDTIPTTSSNDRTPKVCIVMGKEYEIGASLPHDTGNCVECICGAGAQVTCSPHQCAPPGDDINDYRPPGPRPLLTDTF